MTGNVSTAVSVREMARGLTMAFFMIYGAFWLSIVLFPSVLLIVIPSRRVVVMRRAYISTLCGIYLNYTYFLIEYLSGTRVHIYCDDPTILSDNSGVIILSNHRTRTDWLYVGLCYGSFISVMSNMVIILKDSLRTAPIFGWLMQLALYIFLKRNRDDDLPHISKMLAYLTSLGTIPSLLLFPEGTDLSDSNIEKSNRFASSNNLPQYKYVLHPKPSGLVTALNCYREQEHDLVTKTAVIHDITIAYEDYHVGVRSSEKSFLFGKFPTAVHLIINRIPIDSFPTEKRDIEKWLRQSFDRKESMLSGYYSLPESISSTSTPLPHEQSLSIHTIRRKHLISSVPPEIPLPLPRAAARRQSVVVMTLGMCVLTLLLYYWIFSRWIVAGIVIVYVSSAHAFSGFDNLELLLHSAVIIPNFAYPVHDKKTK